VKKNLKLLALSLALLLTACGGGGQTEPKTEEVAVKSGEEVEALADTTMKAGTVLNASDCAIMVDYRFPAQEGVSEEEMLEKVAALAEANGYAPIGQQGEGTKVYASMGDGEGGAHAVTLGEDGSFRTGVLAGEQGTTRRFAQKNIIWTGEDGKDWKIDNVSEEDYYEEDGKQFPCYMIQLTPAS